MHVHDAASNAGRHTARITTTPHVRTRHGEDNTRFTPNDPSWIQAAGSSLHHARGGGGGGDSSTGATRAGAKAAVAGSMMNGGWDDSGSGGGVLVERVPRRLEDSGTRRDRPAGGGSPVVPGVDRQKNAHSTSVQAGLGARTEQAPWEKVRGGRASAGHSPNAFAGASDLPAGKGAKAAQSPARSSVTGGSSASALGESKWERRDRSMPSWKGLHVDDLLPVWSVCERECV